MLIIKRKRYGKTKDEKQYILAENHAPTNFKRRFSYPRYNNDLLRLTITRLIIS